MNSAVWPAATGDAVMSHAGRLVLRAHARWPEDSDVDRPPELPAFVLSTFSPLVAAVADRCLRQRYGEPASAPVRRPTAIVLMSARGDMTTAREVARAVDGRVRIAPLMFFQAVPNSVAGYVAARWGLTGPVICMSPIGDALGEALTIAEALLVDGDADEALVMGVEQNSVHGGVDEAVAVLVAPSESALLKEEKP